MFSLSKHVLRCPSVHTILKFLYCPNMFLLFIHVFVIVLSLQKCPHCPNMSSVFKHVLVSKNVYTVQICSHFPIISSSSIIVLTVHKCCDCPNINCSCFPNTSLLSKHVLSFAECHDCSNVPLLSRDVSSFQKCP